MCAGKSELCENLQSRYDATVVKTRDLIRQQRPKAKEERGALQRAGEALDRADAGAWVGNALVRIIENARTSAVPTGLFNVTRHYGSGVSR